MIACHDLDCKLSIVDIASGKVLATESFEKLMQGRGKSKYVISKDGKWVSDSSFHWQIAEFGL